MWVTCPDILIPMFTVVWWFMERGTITIHGMGDIIIPVLLPGDMEYIIIHIPVGDFLLELVMVGSVGVSILTEGLTGVRADTTEGIDMDIIEVTGMVPEVDIGQGIEQANGIQIGMYITIEALELNKAVMPEMHRLQTI